MTNQNPDTTLDASDFLAWKSHPVTIALFDFLTTQRRDVLEAWAKRVYTAESESGTLQLNAGALGRVECLDDLINLTIEDLNE